MSEPLLVQVAYPGDPARFYTRFDSSTAMDQKEPIVLQLPTTPSVDKNITPLESMESFMSMIHPAHRDTCLTFAKGDPNRLKEEKAPRQVMNRNWMWEEVLHSLPTTAAEQVKLARNHKLPVDSCAFTYP